MREGVTPPSLPGICRFPCCAQYSGILYLPRKHGQVLCLPRRSRSPGPFVGQRCAVLFYHCHSLPGGILPVATLAYPEPLQPLVRRLPDIVAVPLALPTALPEPERLQRLLDLLADPRMDRNLHPRKL